MKVNPTDTVVKISDIGSQYFRNYDLRKMTFLNAPLNRSRWHLCNNFSSVGFQKLKNRPHLGQIPMIMW